MHKYKSYLRKLLAVITCFVAVIMFASCEKENDEGQGAQEVFCTADFQYILLKIKYPDGRPYQFDSSKVFWVSENRYLERYSSYRIEGRVRRGYIIVDDIMQEELLNKQEVMHFTGYKNNKVVYERDVLVGADCCHIMYLGTEPLEQIIE
ncbi:MAG TPA: hypothetical protein PLL66_05760 [Bacteroidales bacterium]|nr:hypothetical protein [Bacteroidales bacterium]